MGVPGMTVFAAADSNEAQRRQATQSIRTYFVQESGRWMVHGAVLDAATHKTVRAIEAQASGPEALGAALVTAVWSGGPKLAWRPDAVQAYGRALRSAPSEMPDLLKAAVAADPNIEDAWRRLAHIDLAAGRRQEALAILRRAPKTPALTLLAATVSGDNESRLAALREVTRANPGDWEPWAQLAALSTQSRRYADGAEAFGKAIALAPMSTALRNEGAYAFQLAGRHGEAVEQAREYAKIAATSANPIDTLGEILAMAGKFADSEKAFLDAQSKDAAFLGGAAVLKAALVRRTSGDQAGADALFEKYAKANDKLVRAQWDYTSGRQRKAEDALASQAGAAARAQLAIWKRDPTILSADTTKPEVALARAILTGETTNPLLKGCHFLLAGKFADAVTPMEQAWRAIRPDQASHIPVLLAWAYLETGRVEEARGLLAMWPVPRSGGGLDSFIEFLAFPRVLELRKRAGL